MSQKLAGKVAIITGGSDGIGEATALRFAEEGAKVVIMARGETKGLNVQENIRSKGGDATFISCDVANSESVRKGDKYITTETIDLDGGYAAKV